MTFTGSGTVSDCKFYINAVNRYNFPTGLNFVTAANSISLPQTSGSMYLQDVRVYQIVLSQANVTALYNLNGTLTTPSGLPIPTLWYTYNGNLLSSGSLGVNLTTIFGSISYITRYGATQSPSITIGYRAGYGLYSPSSIILNASGNDLSSYESGFYVSPINAMTSTLSTNINSVKDLIFNPITSQIHQSNTTSWVIRLIGQASTQPGATIPLCYIGVANIRLTTTYTVPVTRLSVGVYSLNLASYTSNLNTTTSVANISYTTPSIVVTSETNCILYRIASISTIEVGMVFPNVSWRDLTTGMSMSITLQE
jgi:hypothetical protein